LLDLPTLEPGQSKRFPFESLGVVGKIDLCISIGHDNWKLWVMGEVLYEDATGVQRRTLFCRRYDTKAERFVIEDDPDYEAEG